ncbi:MAG: methyltransferase domain-containing protein [Candidatus Lokiarchaeota archaeon]|nr:methyltransferase domain-containing protein [Candidatus Lokiarchaeota archaeon]MBD3339979.1 methyltransferase domain-containing protein [Candidatus Lokiarchaeota archaeon]
MNRKNSIPNFPISYQGKKAEDYNNTGWMKRNQKKTTLKCIEFLYDDKLGFQEINPSDNLVIDLGCGTGFSSITLVEFGFKVIGIDILRDMIYKASHKRIQYDIKGLELILADIKNLPIRCNAINHTISISAYNFITHNARNVKEKTKYINSSAKHLSQILKEGARCIIEFYPENDEELEIFSNSFIKNGFNGFYIKQNQNQKSGQTFLLLNKE